MPERETEIVERHAEPGEHVRGTFCAYAWGIGRRVIGVTDQRFMLIKSRYWSVHGRRLLWADPIEKVALREHASWFTYMTPTGGQRGNSYLHIRRASGRKPTVNSRQAFIGRHSSADEAIDALCTLGPTRTDGEAVGSHARRRLRPVLDGSLPVQDTRRRL